MCRSTGTTCRTTIGNAGGTGACCDPANPSLSTCVSQNPCENGILYKWGALPVAWYFNPNNMAGQSGFVGLTDVAIEAALKTAWSAWSGPSCTSFRAAFGGRTTAALSTSDRRVVAYLPTETEWTNMRLPASVLGQTTTSVLSTGEIVDADTAFNPKPASGNWGLHPNVANDQIDFVDIAAHEFGHAIGLGHSHLLSSLMYYAVRGLGPLWTGLSQDEVDAVCATYPTQCTFAAQCTSSPCLDCVNGQCVPKDVPPPADACKPCRSDADCSGGSCQQLQGALRCLKPCGGGGCCPRGTSCQALSGKQICVPTAGSCPSFPCTSDAQCGMGERCIGGVCKIGCQSDADCAAGYGCQNQLCQKITPGQLGAPCSSSRPCEQGFTCYATGSGAICSIPCGASSAFPAGTPGSPCLPGQQCLLGATCINYRGQRRICAYSCQSSTSCVVGGFCSYLNRNAVCLCSLDSDCRLGRKCNKTEIKGNLGICTYEGIGCPAGYACQNSGGSQVCLPTSSCGNGTCETGESCGNCAADCGCTGGKSCVNNSCSYCGNGVCDPNQGESCATCPNDCLCSGGRVCVSGSCSFCGNNICDTSQGESCANCPNDCACPAGERCQNGACQPNSQCGNGTCGATEDCSSCPADCKCSGGQVCNNGTCSFCGNNICESSRGESCATCSRDCLCGSGQICAAGGCSYCGNNVCEASRGENCSTCPRDCACSGGQVCASGACSYCGDGKCESSRGESCTSCAKDCGCQSGESCLNGTCTTCGNGTCDANESCTSCPADCKCASGQVCASGACSYCGNGTCEASRNEDCATCAKDCACPSGQSCASGQCVQSSSCGNGTCDAGESCTSCPSDCPCGQGEQCVSGTCKVVIACGNGTCEAGEDCTTCAKDCACSGGRACVSGTCQFCGNGRCEPDQGENCSVCAQDCKCLTDQRCTAGACVDVVTCGNGKCETGEDCGTCAKDCPCNAGLVCRQGQCETPAQACGNGTCEAGENCGSCAQDCGCPGGQICQSGSCRPTTSETPVTEPLTDAGPDTGPPGEPGPSDVPDATSGERSEMSSPGDGTAEQGQERRDTAPETKAELSPDVPRKDDAPDAITKEQGNQNKGCTSDSSCGPDQVCSIGSDGKGTCQPAAASGCGCQGTAPPGGLALWWLLLLCGLVFRRRTVATSRTGGRS